ncbi:hypothetical protein C0992_003749, partial [Termitomyces sp. T32_za158]
AGVAANSNSNVASNNENHLSLLSRYDVVLLVDDSGSMSGDLWKEARKALQDLATEASKYDEDGIEIRFLNSSDVLTTKDPNAVKALFKRINPAGLTPLGRKIGYLLSDYMDRFADQSDLKPVIYIVITDGEASDGPKTEQAVIQTARALDEANAKPDQVGIQFVQIGNDSNATEYLQMLDNTLTSRAGIRVRRLVFFLCLPECSPEIVRIPGHG